MRVFFHLLSSPPCRKSQIVLHIKARFLVLQLLWDRVEGDILGERLAKRAAIESRAAGSVAQILRIRRIAVSVIKVYKRRAREYRKRRNFQAVSITLAPLVVMRRSQGSRAALTLSIQRPGCYLDIGQTSFGFFVLGEGGWNGEWLVP